MTSPYTHCTCTMVSGGPCAYCDQEHTRAEDAKFDREPYRPAIPDCPFCGGNHGDTEPDTEDPDRFRVTCYDCWCTGPPADTEDEALREWKVRGGKPRWEDARHDD